MAGAASVLAAVLDQPQAAESIFRSLGSVAGLTFEAGTPKRLWRAAEPARLTAGDWQFAATDPGTAVAVRHSVREVVLSRSVLPASEAAGVLARAVVDTAARHGPAATEALAALLDAWGELAGMPHD